MSDRLTTLGRIDTGDHSVRIERSDYVSVQHGPRSKLLITTYRKVIGDRWCRVASVVVRRAQLAELAGMLEALARNEPAVAK